MIQRKVKIDSIDDYNRMYGLKTRHPLVSVVRMEEATEVANHFELTYGVYALFLKNGVGCTMKYGRRSYDYQEGTVVSFAPGQVIEVEMVEGEIARDVVGLLFHPDLIYGTPLGARIGSFDFFDYSQMEALHLSADERALFVECLDRIDRELDSSVDAHSATLLSANIQLLLEYLSRFYDRQFYTRHRVNSEIVSQFERLLRDYFFVSDGRDSLPTVQQFASELNLTPKYLSALVKRETGYSARELITQQITDTAKQLLTSSTDDVSQIAYHLGFQHPAHFTRMFRQQTGQTPTKYRELQQMAT